METNYAKKVSQKLKEYASDFKQALARPTMDHFVAVFSKAQDDALGKLLIEFGPLQGKTKGHGRVAVKEVL